MPAREHLKEGIWQSTFFMRFEGWSEALDSFSKKFPAHHRTGYVLQD
jgi:hypothetical protein